MWEYRAIDLGSIPTKASDIDELNRLGKEGWELVAITVNGLAYFKRQVARPMPSRSK
jgi:hypothetical protein